MKKTAERVFGAFLQPQFFSHFLYYCNGKVFPRIVEDTKIEKEKSSLLSRLKE